MIQYSVCVFCTFQYIYSFSQCTSFITKIASILSCLLCSSCGMRYARSVVRTHLPSIKMWIAWIVKKKKVQKLNYLWINNCWELKVSLQCAPQSPSHFSTTMLLAELYKWGCLVQQTTCNSATDYKPKQLPKNL